MRLYVFILSILFILSKFPPGFPDVPVSKAGYKCLPN